MTLTCETETQPNRGRLLEQSPVHEPGGPRSAWGERREGAPQGEGRGEGADSVNCTCAGDSLMNLYTAVCIWSTLLLLYMCMHLRLSDFDS
jgi:hypothetical protein